MASGSSIVIVVVLVAHMYVAAVAVPSMMPIKMRSIMDTS